MFDWWLNNKTLKNFNVIFIVTGDVDCGFGYVSCLASQFVEYTSEIGCRLYSGTWLFNRRHPISTRLALPCFPYLLAYVTFEFSLVIILALWYVQCIVCFWRDSPQWEGASHSWGSSITHDDALQSEDFCGRVISLSQRPAPDNTQHSRQTSMPPAVLEPTISAGERPP